MLMGLQARRGWSIRSGSLRGILRVIGWSLVCERSYWNGRCGRIRVSENVEFLIAGWSFG